jgi:SurA-like N-terminal domain/PPIC-type PPIASE domain
MTQLNRARRTHAFRQRLTALAQRSKRTVLLPVAGIVVGLAAAALGVLKPVSRTLTSVPAGYVALVNQEPILMSDFISETQSRTQEPYAQTTPEQRRQVLREMIDKELLVQRAVALDLPETTTEVRDTMAAAVNAQVVAPLLAIAPTTKDLEDFYDAHRAKYTMGGTMTLHDLVLHYGGFEDADQTLAQAELDAAAAVYQLRSGSPIDYVKEHFGFVDSGRVSDGTELEFAARIHLGPKLYSVAAALDDGEVSDPVVAKDGIHVLVMYKRELPSLATYSLVRKQVYSDYREAEFQRADLENLTVLRDEAQILIAPGFSQ